MVPISTRNSVRSLPDFSLLLRQAVDDQIFRHSAPHLVRQSGGDSLPLLPLPDLISEASADPGETFVRPKLHPLFTPPLYSGACEAVRRPSTNSSRLPKFYANKDHEKCFYIGSVNDNTAEEIQMLSAVFPEPDAVDEEGDVVPYLPPRPRHVNSRTAAALSWTFPQNSTLSN